MTDGVFGTWWKKLGYLTKAEVGQEEVLGNTLMELFFDSSLRYDEIELVATLVCSHQSDRHFPLV